MPWSRSSTSGDDVLERRGADVRFEHVILVSASGLAALGQLLFKVGATGRTHWREMVNLPILSGVLCYGLGTISWIFALSKLPLRVVYPYTALTFVFVYLGAIGYLGERLDLRSLFGVVFVLLGLFLLTANPAS